MELPYPNLPPFPSNGAISEQVLWHQMNGINMIFGGHYGEVEEQPNADEQDLSTLHRRTN